MTGRALLFYQGLALLTILLPGATLSVTYDLCDTKYLEVDSDSEYHITVNNATAKAVTNRPCRLYLEACSTCQISLQLLPRSNFQFWCESDIRSLTACNIGCDALFVFDKYYLNDTLRFFSNSEQFTFTSVSSSLYIGLCHINSSRYNFTIVATVRSKTQSFNGSSISESLGSTGVFMSPLFNNGSYALNHETYRYTFESSLPTDYILLIFSDWHLAASSSLYFENSNKLTPVTGDKDRPMVISRSNKMTVVFNTGEALAADQPREFVGFKANYSFIEDSNPALPSTRCESSGYDLNSVGGSFLFVASPTTSQLLDCVWVWKTQPGFTGIRARVIKFQASPAATRGDNEVSFYEGLTSNGQLIKTFDSLDNVDRGMVLFATKGFYVRLTSKSKVDILKISYASYHEGNNCARLPGMFSCGYHCIDASLHCDGIDHCGDNTDEITQCGAYTETWDKSYQYTLTIGVIVPMVISVFLIMVLCFLFVMIRRCRRARLLQQRDGSIEHLETVSEDVSARRGRRRRRRRRNMMPDPERDQPPSYNEAMENPPGWYINVAFGNPVDPSLPSPPPYTEIAEDYPAQAAPQVTNQRTPNSPSSSESSQSEVTICSRNHSASSSSSEDEGERWDTRRRDGRHGRLSRHLSSSDSDTEGGFAPIPSSATQNTLLSESSVGTSQLNRATRRDSDQGKLQQGSDQHGSKVSTNGKKTSNSSNYVVPDRDKLRNDGVLRNGRGVNSELARKREISVSNPQINSRNMTGHTQNANKRMTAPSCRSLSNGSDKVGFETNPANAQQFKDQNSSRYGLDHGRSSRQDHPAAVQGNQGRGARGPVDQGNYARFEPLSAENLCKKTARNSRSNEYLYRPTPRSGHLPMPSQISNSRNRVIMNEGNDGIVASDNKEPTGHPKVPAAQAPKLSAALSMDTLNIGHGQQISEDTKKKSRSEFNLTSYSMQPLSPGGINDGRDTDLRDTRGQRWPSQYDAERRDRGQEEAGGVRFISLALEEDEGGDIYV